MSFDPVSSLRDALKLSPDNVPLRITLARTLLSLGRADEAERELKSAQQIAPASSAVKSALAAAFAQQNKNSAAIVLLEELCKAPDAPPDARVLFARLLLAAGDAQRAAFQYRRAIEQDPASENLELSARLGISSGPAAPDAESEVVDGRVRNSAADAPAEAPANVERPKITFADVGGLEALKEEVRMKIIHPLKHADLFKAYGKSIGGGILLYGPPGCGKTHLARATAGEINASFISVGIHEVLDMWVGSSERNLAGVFAEARSNKPCVLFFDEVDALAASRADMRHSHARMLINQFLAEMDGISARNDGLLILAATNAPWHVDSAFRRPGRFDRILFVPPPDEPALASILAVLLKGKPAADIDYAAVAKKMAGFSGADVKAVVDQAVEAKLQQVMKTGNPTPLNTRDLVTAAGGIKASTREWFASARNYALYANQGGAYDDILKYMQK